MNIFVTGGAGYLGTALCQSLRAQGHDVTAPTSQECDLRRSDALAAFDGQRYEQIFHLAAWTQAGDFCLTHAGEQWIANQQINTSVLAWWQQRQPQAKLVCMGTSCAYAPEQPLAEPHYLDGTPIDSLFTYAHTKRMLYIGLLAQARQHGLRYLCLVPSTLYGPGYHTDGRQMHFIFDLIRKILRGKKYGETVTLWGDGYQQRELVYRDDFVQTMLELNGRCDNELINIGAGVQHTIRDFAGLICELVGYDRDLIVYDTSKYVGARSKCLDVTKLRALAPRHALTPLRAGLAETVAWFERYALDVLAPAAPASASTAKG